MEDLSDAVALLSTGSYVVTRRGPSGYSDGIRVPPDTEALTIVASVQPLSGQEVRRMAEGKRDREAMAVYTATELRGSGSAFEPDLIAIDGAVFEVDKVERWAAAGNYYRAVVLRKAGT